MTDWAQERERFEIPRGVAYINCAYMSPLSKGVAEAGERGVRQKMQPWTVTTGDFFDPPDRARVLFGEVLGGVDGSCVAVVPAASYGLAVAALNVGLSRGGEVVVLEGQFPSNVYVWKEKARVVGGSVRTVGRPNFREGETWTQGVLEAMTAKTQVVSVPQCHWSDGGVLDLVAIGERCRALGAALVLDLSQSAGVMPVDIAAVDPDFAIAVTYKWLMGPYGMGFVYVAPRHHGGRPLEETWLGRRGSEDFAGLVKYQDAYGGGAVRFDMGERSQLQLMPMVVRALEEVLERGVERVYDELSRRNQRLLERLEPLGMESCAGASRAGHYLALEWPKGAFVGVGDVLRREKIFVSFRGRAMRVTQHVYNTEEDVDRLVACLKASA